MSYRSYTLSFTAVHLNWNKYTITSSNMLCSSDNFMGFYLKLSIKKKNEYVPHRVHLSTRLTVFIYIIIIVPSEMHR